MLRRSRAVVFPWPLLMLLAAACGGPAPAADGAAAMPADHGGAAATTAPAGHEIPAGDPVPTIGLRLDGQTGGVWSFTVATDMNLTLETAPYEPMRGHVHVYVDGVEKQMIADKVFQIQDLTPGPHEISVALANTNHKNLLSGGQMIAARTEIVVPEGR